MKPRGAAGARIKRETSHGIALGGVLLLASCRSSPIVEDASDLLSRAEIDQIAACGHEWVRSGKTAGLNSRHLLMWDPDGADVVLVADVPSHTNKLAKWFIAHDSDHDGITDDIDLIWWRDGEQCAVNVAFGGKSRKPAIMLSLGERSWVDAGRYDGQWDKRAIGFNSNAEYRVAGQWLPSVASTNGRGIVVFQGRPCAVSFAETNIVLTPLDGRP